MADRGANIARKIQKAYREIIPYNKIVIYYNQDSIVTVERLKLLSSLSGGEFTSQCVTATNGTKVIIGLMMSLDIPHAVTSAVFLNLVQKILILCWG